MAKIKRHLVLQEFSDGSWSIREFSGASLQPATYKANAQDLCARLLQLVDVSSCGAQTTPESTELTPVDKKKP